MEITVDRTGYQDPPTIGETYIGKIRGKQATEPIRFPLGTIVLSERDSEDRLLVCVLPLTVLP